MKTNNEILNYKFMDLNTSHSILDTIQNHPKAGTIVTGATFVGSHLVKLADGSTHINPIIIESFQIGGYAITMLVGLFTVLGYAKKFRKEKTKPN